MRVERSKKRKLGAAEVSIAIKADVGVEWEGFQDSNIKRFLVFITCHISFKLQS